MATHRGAVIPSMFEDSVSMLTADKMVIDNIKPGSSRLNIKALSVGERSLPTLTGMSTYQSECIIRGARVVTSRSGVLLCGGDSATEENSNRPLTPREVPLEISWKRSVFNKS